MTMRVNKLSLSDIAFLSFAYRDQNVLLPEIFVWLEDHIEQSAVSTKKFLLCSLIHFV